jgi:hypothetical protein
VVFRKADESFVSLEKLENFFDPALLGSKTVTTSESCISE